MNSDPTKNKREHYAAWFERRTGPRNLKIEKEILAIASAYDKAMETGVLTEEQLQMVVDGVSSRNQLMWDSTSSLLRKLAERWQIAADAILQLSRSNRAHARFAAICCLSKNIDDSITNVVLKAALVDKSGKIRSKAGETAFLLDLRSLIPDLELTLLSETNVQVKGSLELCLRMLRDGLWLKSMPDGRTDVVVRTVRWSIASKTYSEAELRVKGIDAIIEYLRK